LSYSQSGRLASFFGGSRLRSISLMRASRAVSSSDRPPSESAPMASAMPSTVRRRMTAPVPAKSVKNDL